MLRGLHPGAPRTKCRGLAWHNQTLNFAPIAPPCPVTPRTASDVQARQTTDRVINSSQAILGPMLADLFGTPGGVVVSAPRCLGRGATAAAAAAAAPVQAPAPAAADAGAAAAAADAAAAATAAAVAAKDPRAGGASSRGKRNQAAADSSAERNSAPEQPGAGADGALGRDQETESEWERAPRCTGEPLPGPSVLRDASGHLWGWQDGASCGYKEADGQPITHMDPFVGVSWEEAPACREPRTEDNVVQDNFGRSWGWQDGNSCRYDD
jgi:hypothetical protein